MSHWLGEGFGSYGFAVIVIAIYLEGCGVPLPGETVLLAGGFFAGQGSLPLLGVLVAAFLAAVAGDNSGYWIGRRGGRALVERHGRWVGLTAQRLESIAGFYDRHGAKTILIARFLSGVRAFAPLFAGISRIPWRRYAAVDAVACLLWSTAVGLVGYAFGESWQHIEHWIGRAGLSLWVLAIELTVLGTLAGVAGRVVAHRATRFDQHVADRLAAAGGPLVDGLLAVFAALGSAPAALVIVLLVTLWCFLRGRRVHGLVMATMYLVSLALSADLSRALTWWNGALGIFSGLLSGNALVAAIAYGAAALLLTFDRPHWRC